jgi:acetamidase/formamidase
LRCVAPTEVNGNRDVVILHRPGTVFFPVARGATTTLGDQYVIQMNRHS